jgi:hypothetical protein
VHDEVKVSVVGGRVEAEDKYNIFNMVQKSVHLNYIRILPNLTLCNTAGVTPGTGGSFVSF